MVANEKRLIDANALLEKVQFRLPIDNKNAEVIAGCVDITRRLIENAPTVDAVEVVRCMACKKWCRNAGIVDSPNGHCFCHDIDTNQFDFCSYGERRAE